MLYEVITIEGAVRDGAVDVGLVIHEGQLTYADMGDGAERAHRPGRHPAEARLVAEDAA